MLGALLKRLLPALAAGMALVGTLPTSAHAAEKTDISQIPSDGWKPNEDDRWLFDLRSGQYRLGDGVRGYQTPQGLCVDLADVVLALDLAVRVDRKLRRATGWVLDERRTFLIDRDAGEVRAGSERFRIGANTIRDTAAGWCVDLASLSKWIGVPISADLSNAVLRIDSKEKLPFQLAAERRARAATIRPQTRFDLASLPQAPRPYRMWSTPSVDVVASAGVVSDKQGGSSTQARYEIFAAGELLKQSFDARLSSDDKGVPDSLRLRLYRTDPTGQLLGPLHATHYAVGDVSLLSTGIVAQSVPGRGAVLTNRPVERPDAFDKTDFRGDLPAGWDAELYRNGQLLAFTSPNGDGRYEFLGVPTAIWIEPVRNRPLWPAGASAARNPAVAGRARFDSAAKDLVLGRDCPGRYRPDRVRRAARRRLPARLARFGGDRARPRYPHLDRRLFPQPVDRKCPPQLWRSGAAPFDRTDLAGGRRCLCRRRRSRAAGQLARRLWRNLYPR